MLSSVELTDNVWIETTQRRTRQATIETAYALYDKTADRFELKNGVHMFAGNDPPADIRSQRGLRTGERKRAPLRKCRTDKRHKLRPRRHGRCVSKCFEKDHRRDGQGIGLSQEHLTGTGHRAVGRSNGRRFRRRSANTKGKRDGKHKGSCHAD